MQVFVQLYHAHMTEEQKHALVVLMRRQVHKGITPVIRQALVEAHATDSAAAAVVGCSVATVCGSAMDE